MLANASKTDEKIRLVEEAKSSLDLTYYIYADDQSSSVLSEALIAAARRGVKVRLLVDYQTNYKRLDMFAVSIGVSRFSMSMKYSVIH